MFTPTHVIIDHQLKHAYMVKDPKPVDCSGALIGGEYKSATLGVMRGLWTTANVSVVKL